MFFVVLFVLWVGYLIGRSRSDGRIEGPTSQEPMLQRIINALVGTANKEMDKAKSKETKSALKRVIDAGYMEQYGYVPGQEDQPKEESFYRDTSSKPPINRSVEVPTQVIAESSSQAESMEQQEHHFRQAIKKQDIDNTSLLLYFGAFLFITSVGLFVGFSDVDGQVRTFLVALVALAMYSVGYWLHGFKKLKQVGITFVGIGLAIIPFIGVALVHFVYDGENGPAVWFSTSLFALVVYLASLYKFRNTLITYMFMASLISLLQSSADVAGSAQYYHIWAMMVTGFIFQILGRFTKSLPELKDSSAEIANWIVPLSMVGSFLVIGTEGYWQLSVSLAMGSMYYLVQSVVQETQKDVFQALAHGLAIFSIVVGAFAIEESLVHAAYGLLFINLFHASAVIGSMPRKHYIPSRLIDIMLMSSVAGVAFGFTGAHQLVGGLVVMLVLGLAVVAKSQRTDAFTLALVAWSLLSVAVGQYLPEEALTFGEQSVLTFVFSLPLLPVLYLNQRKQNLPSQWGAGVAATIASLHVVSVVFSYLSGGYAVLLASGAAILVVLVLAETNKLREWPLLASLYTLLPVGHVIVALSDTYDRSLPLFTLSVISALVVNIYISLRFKLDLSRFLSTAAWLALPYALGIEQIWKFNLVAGLQLWLYIFVAYALTVSRGIARGKLFVVPGSTIKTLSREASSPYEIGAFAAAFVASILAFAANGVVLPIAGIVTAGALIVAAGILIDNDSQYTVLAPAALQVAILRAFLPGEYTVLVVSVLAVAGILLVAERNKSPVWYNVASYFTTMPLVHAIVSNDSYRDRILPLFTVSVLTILVINIFIALRHKSALGRWLSTAGWLLLPVVLGGEKVWKFDGSAEQLVWMYVFVTFALTVSSSIARGRLFISPGSSMESMSRANSLQYRAGALVAGGMVAVLAFVADGIFLPSAAMLAALVIIVAGGAYVEREPSALALLPAGLQLVLFRAVLPYDTSSSWIPEGNVEHLFIIASSCIATGLYFWGASMKKGQEAKGYATQLRKAAMISALVAPLSFYVGVDVVWTMPLSLVVAAGVLMHYNWVREQGYRELIGVVGLAGIFWLMYYLGVENIHVYTHVLALLFGLYSYVRSAYVHDQATSDNYLYAALSISTVPLVLQALAGGDNANLYGLWLLSENAAIAILGATLRRQIMIKWGLYVSIATIIFELRALGWAVVAIISIVVIGVAIARALKQQDDEPEK